MFDRKGDKVRVKSGPSRGVKGIISEVRSGLCNIDPFPGGVPIAVGVQDIVNYSAAARKAWKKMPERKVGRPKGSIRADRVSVTFRIERTLWESYLQAERKGALPERNVLIDEMVKKCLKDAERTRTIRSNK
jgi:ribosomal protein L24